MIQKDEQFDLPVKYKGGELMLPSRLVQMGYTFKIYVQIEGVEVIFEPDEEKNFRAIVESSVKALNPELVKAAAQGLEEVWR
jgi:hypothetical protein